MRNQVSLKMIVFILILGVAALPSFAQRGDDAERASKNGQAAGTIDGVEVTVEYGRPNVKGREIWGGLVPYGKVWRTGADEATTITLSGDVTVEGKALPAGKYAVFTIPNEDKWTVIFNKTAKQWGAFKYDSGQDALRVTVAPKKADFVESLDFEIDGPAVVLRWDKLAVPVTINPAD
ncbi:MAG: DUF2911 domain-containing protein [Thermoanaerobaculia bacterium]